MIRRQLLPAVTMIAIFTVLTGLMYPLAMTGIAQGVFGDEANGSLIERDGEPVGSALIAQSFNRPEYFHARPSAAGEGYDSGASSGSNQGPTNPDLLDAIAQRVATYRDENDLADDIDVPVDAVTSSASGLDPHISLANARLQAARVATARHLDLDQVLGLVHDHTDERALGFLGEPGVNVLELNLTLDGLGET